MMIDTSGGAANGADSNQQNPEHHAMKEHMRNSVEKFMSSGQTKKSIRGLLQKDN